MKWIKWAKEKKPVIVTAAILVVLLIILSGTKLTLFMNFILGNDIVVKLKSDTEAVTFSRGQEANITFEASVTTNPFCKAVCNSKFTDIGKNKIIDQDSFTLRPSLSFVSEYILYPKDIGDGQDLYRFSMECHSVRTAFCHTSEEPTERTILVTVWTELTEGEEKTRAETLNNLQSVAVKLREDLEMLGATKTVIDELEEFVVLTSIKKELANWESELEYQAARLKEAKKSWDQQKITIVPAPVKKPGYDIVEILQKYNSLLEELKEKRETLKILSNMFLNKKMAEAVNESIDDFNDAATIFHQKGTLEEKEKAAEIYIPDDFVKSETRKETLRLELEMDIALDILCQIGERCEFHPTIDERATQTMFDLEFACMEIKNLKNNLSINATGNATEEVRNMKQNITNNYLLSLPENKSNTGIIKNLLKNGTVLDVNISNMTDIMISLGEELSECDEATDLLNLKEITAESIILQSEPLEIIEFSEPEPQCCVWGECSACCKSCKEPSPVVFLHGHAFNEDTSADYSLDAFNKIQKRLEEEGYLDAGVISLYTERDTPAGAWGLSKAPLSLEASYYFDIFKTPENYVIVQTKSENIDTYAIRLKELIDTIQYKTGKEKVIIIAHSMGGLVTRRYLQIFGTDRVEKIILIGTPNHGIMEDIADYCPLIGQKLECRDMKSESLFMNKLNQGDLPKIPIYNIVGTGCSMSNGDGDGIVHSESAELKGAENFMVEGTCQRLKKLHTELLDIDKYPEVYDILLSALS